MLLLCPVCQYIFTLNLKRMCVCVCVCVFVYACVCVFVLGRGVGGGILLVSNGLIAFSSFQQFLGPNESLLNFLATFCTLQFTGCLEFSFHYLHPFRFLCILQSHN